MRTRPGLGALLLALLPPLSVAGGQTVRVSGASSLQYIELRPFVRDSVPVGETDGSGFLRQLPDGSIVRCVPAEAYCSQVRPGDVVSTLPFIHDLSVSAWGFGRGLRLFSQLRGRSSFGDATDLWPRENDHLEVLAMYGELERGTLRVRAGRQWRTSGLGFYNFDGLSLALHPRPTSWLEVYGGRSLSRGLNDGRTSGALETVEPLSALDAGVLVGVQGRYRPTPRLSLGAVYQFDLRGDRRGAYAELAAADGTLRLTPGSIEGSVEVDVAGRALNQARLAFRSNPIGDAALFAEVRRYRPYFELWTIWGAFSPVGFDEASGGVTWATRDGRVLLRQSASYRAYDDPQTESVDAYHTTGWGLQSSVSWSPQSAWHVDASYRADVGFGASGWDLSSAVTHDLGGRGSLALQAVAFQPFYEFRLGSGRVVGLGGAGSFRLTDRTRVAANAMAYRQHGGSIGDMDWTQRRASVRLEWALGGEPAVVPGPGARR